MKHEIQRAFDLTKPNVLHRVLEDAPAPAPAASAKPKKEKKRLSDRAVQFIATAASIALLIGAVSGGIFYYRDYFSGSGSTGSSGSSGSGLDLNSQSPLPTVDYDWSEEGLLQRACDIIGVSLFSSDALIVQRNELITEDGVEQRVIDLQYQRNLYQFRFRADNGALLSILPVSTYGMVSAITESVAAWIALLDLDPAHFGTTQYAEYEVSRYIVYAEYAEGASGSSEVYRVKIPYGDAVHTYEIDVYSGQIAFKYSTDILDTTDPISIESAEKIVIEALLQEQEDCYLISSEDCVDYYRIQVCCTDDAVTADATLALICFEYHVDRESGEILAFDKGLSLWHEGIALAAAEAYGNANGYAPISCQYNFRSGLPSYYQVGMTYENGDDGIFYIQIYDIYNSLTPSVDTGNAIYNARDVALEQYGYTIEDARVLTIDDEAGYFSIYYEVGGHGYSLQVDADGTVLHDSGEREALCPEMPAESIGWKRARDICLADCGRSIYELTGFTWDISGGYFQMELCFTDSWIDYQVDVMTGILMLDYQVDVNDGQISDEPVVDAALLEARDIALAIPGISLDDVIHLEVTLDGDPYRVYFETATTCYKYFLDRDGNVTYDAGTGDVSRPEEGDGLSWRQARDLCLEACGRTLEELTFFGCSYDADGTYYLELAFLDDAFSWYIDAETGAFLEPEITDEPVVDLLSPEEEVAISAAMDHANCRADYLAGALADVSVQFDEGGGIYVVHFLKGDSLWEIEVDAYTGEVISAASAVIEVPDGNIGEENAIRTAAEYAGCLADYEAGALTEVTVKFDEDGGIYWVYFYHDGLYWEIEVGAYNPTVLSAQSWEQDTAS